MKSTQKFLCYSLALVGAALIFSAGCKKGDNVTNTTVVASQKPVLYGAVSVTAAAGLLGTAPAIMVLNGPLSSSVTATIALAITGTTSPTIVGFAYTCTYYTGALTANAAFAVAPSSLATSWPALASSANENATQASSFATWLDSFTPTVATTTYSGTVTATANALGDYQLRIPVNTAAAGAKGVVYTGGTAGAAATTPIITPVITEIRAFAETAAEGRVYSTNSVSVITIQ